MHVQHLPEIVEQSHADIYAIVRVQDPDPGDHGRVDHVEIIEGDADANFRVRKAEGKGAAEDEFNIEVARLLDREVSPYGYNLTLKAVDAGTPPRVYYKNVHVRLADLNDHAPVFDREVYELQVNESAPAGTLLTRLKVSDADTGRNSKVRLNIVAGNEAGHFVVNPTSGALSVARPLDAERKTSYTLTVSALDQASAGMRRQSSAKIRISVLDVNDNDPFFLEDERVVLFDENQPPGASVALVRASDPDSGENGHLSYSLANLDPVPFEVDHFSGEVSSTELLDFESGRREYKLVVRASDWGSPYRRQAEMRLTVKVKDINDNRPQFERVDCSGAVARDTPPGAAVLTLSALDFDAGSVIAYRIVSGNADGCFNLDSAAGVISVVCDLRTLPTRRRELNVTATDGQHFSDVTPVVIRFTEGSVRSSSSFGNVNNFDCRETSVAARLTEVMRAASRANSAIQEDPAFVSASSRNRFGGNVHQPEFDVAKTPRQVRVNETMAPGELVLKVGKRRNPTPRFAVFRCFSPRRKK